jgi:hypothetical protein
MALRDVGPPTETFDVQLEADIAQRTARGMYGGVYYVLLGSGLILGPIFGYVGLTQFIGGIAACLAGLVLGALVVVPCILFLNWRGGPYANLVMISNGVLALGTSGTTQRRIDLRKAGKGIRVVTFSTAYPMPDPYPAQDVVYPWVPWVEVGLRVSTPLSPAAAEALKRAVSCVGWHPQDKEIDSGGLHLRETKFTEWS